MHLEAKLASIHARSTMRAKEIDLNYRSVNTTVGINSWLRKTRSDW
jgi:hypothetical protein